MCHRKNITLYLFLNSNMASSKNNQDIFKEMKQLDLRWVLLERTELRIISYPNNVYVSCVRLIG